MLTTSTNKAYSEPATAKSVVSFDRLNIRAHRRSIGAFFVIQSLWWIVQERPRMRRFSDYGTVNSVQSATLLFDSNGGSSLNNQRTSPMCEPILYLLTGAVAAFLAYLGVTLFLATYQRAYVCLIRVCCLPVEPPESKAVKAGGCINEP